MIRKRLVTAVVVLVILGLLSASYINSDFWLTPDQQAMRLYRKADFNGAAERFVDPFWRGVALYESGEFKTAAGMFSGIDTPEASFNRGNALIFQGQYDEAIESFDQALQSRPDWHEARDNRDIALARRLDPTGGEMTGGKLEADDFVFEDNPESSSGDQVNVTGEEPREGAELDALWLRNVQTKPADFLRLKFAYQSAMSSGEEVDDDVSQ